MAYYSKSVLENIKKKLEEKKTTEDKGGISVRFTPTVLKGKPKTEYKVRILPHIHINDGRDEPWVQAFVHMFKPKNNQGKLIYQLCPYTFEGEKYKCPICEYSRKMFEKGDKVSEDIGRSYWRKKRWFLNVLVKSDPRPSEENQAGRVLIWEVGSKIFDKFTEAITRHELLFWDPEDGYDFDLVIKTVADYPNYDASEFARNSSSLGSKNEIDNIYKQIIDLNKFLAPMRRSYDELKIILEGKSPIVTKDGRGNVEVSAQNDAEDIQFNKNDAQILQVTEGKQSMNVTNQIPQKKPQPKTTSDDEINIDEIDFDSAPF